MRKVCNCFCRLLLHKTEPQTHTMREALDQP